MKDNWDDYRIFIALAEQGSLAKTGKSLNIQHTTVLRRINALEQRLSVRLFERLRTGYTLTEPGEKMVSTIAHLKNEILNAERGILGEDVKLSGTIRISTTDTIGYFWLPKFVAKFKLKYPEIELDIDITTRHRDLTAREADVVLPAVNVQPDYMIGRAIRPIHFRLYAHKELNISPLTQYTYNDHDFLLPNEVLRDLPASRYIKQFYTRAAAVTSDKITGLYFLCKQRMGITLLPDYIGDHDADLECVGQLPMEVQKNSIWILNHPGLRNNARIKAFTTFLRMEADKEVACLKMNNDFRNGNRHADGHRQIG